jgi:hypothetical protein
MMTCKQFIRSRWQFKVKCDNHDGRPFSTGKPSGTTGDTPNPWRCNDGAFYWDVPAGELVEYDKQKITAWSNAGIGSI